MHVCRRKSVPISRGHLGNDPVARVALRGRWGRATHLPVVGAAPVHHPTALLVIIWVPTRLNEVFMHACTLLWKKEEGQHVQISRHSCMYFIMEERKDDGIY